MNRLLRHFLEKNTTLSEQEISEVIANILVNTYKKETVLLKQGDISEKCYFVLKGCIRQYSVGDDGRETTYNFFTEGQAVVLFKSINKKNHQNTF